MANPSKATEKELGEREAMDKREEYTQTSEATAKISDKPSELAVE